MKIDIDRYKEIIDTLSRNRSRTLLTGFGIFWGIFMLLIMLGGGDGLKKMLSENFEGFASNSIIIGTNNTSKPYGGFKRDRSWLMDASDIKAIKTMVPDADVVTMVEAQWGGGFAYEDRTYTGLLKGLTSEYTHIESPKILFGRWINEVDCKKNEKPMPKLPVATAFWTPRPNLQTGAESWIICGGAHHTAFTYDLTTEQMVDWADAMGIEAVVIDADTTIRGLKNELRWNAASYK